MRSSRLGRIAESVTDHALASRVLGVVVDHTIEQGVAHFKKQLADMLGVLDDELLLVRKEGEDSQSETLLLELGECHRKAAVAALHRIEATESYGEMVRAVIDGLEGCQNREVQDDIESRITSLEDPLARAFVRAFLFERDYVLDLLKFLKESGSDDLRGKDLVRLAPDIMMAIRFSQSDLLREVIRSEPQSVVARGLNAFLKLKHAGDEAHGSL